ncbi:MAG: hypothetical protein LWW86_04805 [Micrococcales bacterium]|nr:hypothetical protein [Micrococcales bacterium]
MRKGLVVGLAALALVGGCGSGDEAGSGESTTAEPVLTLDTADAEGGRTAALEPDGVLMATIDGGKACFWVATPEGEVSLVWPKGSKAYYGAIRVVDKAGKVIATEGDSGKSYGGSMTTQLTGCRPDSQVWVVSEVAERG